MSLNVEMMDLNEEIMVSQNGHMFNPTLGIFGQIMLCKWLQGAQIMSMEWNYFWKKCNCLGF